MKILKYIMIFGVTTAFMSSCMMGPKFQKIEVETPQAYLGEHIGADSINLKWWEIFDDHVLDTLVVHALEYNKDVLMAAKRIEQARAYHGMAKADLLPVFDISGGAARGNYMGAGNKMSAADKVIL